MNKVDNFVFVESPNKIKVIKNILTKSRVIDNFQVLSTKGHVRAVYKYDNTTLQQEIHWKELEHVKNIIKSLTDMKFCNDNTIYIATDSDREGEAIGWHVTEILKKHFNYCKAIIRVYYRELSYHAVSSAFIQSRDNYTQIDNNLVNAYKARVAIDLIIGMNGSRILWDKLIGCKSIGRVQTVSIMSIFEKEQHIRQFTKTKYYSILCNLPYQKEYIKMSSLSIDGKQIEKIETKQEADSIVKILLQKQYKLYDIVKTNKYSSILKPLDTTDLIIKAGNIYGLSTNEIYSMCQKLYEGIEIENKTIIGLITYMRTDSHYISDTFIPQIKKYIINTYGEQYFNTVQLSRKQNTNKQEAHEAVRITTFENHLNIYKDKLNLKEFKLLKVIFLHTVGVFMKPTTYENNEIIVQSTDQKIQIKYTVNIMQFPGIYKLKQDLNILDNYKNIDINALLQNINNIQFDYEERHTKCPERHSEYSLIKELRDKGIGRPSTYNYIINVIKNREYVFMYKNKYHITSKGITLVMFVYIFMHEFINYSFTHAMEQMLDDITTGKTSYTQLLNMFIHEFVNTTSRIQQHTKLQTIQKVAERMLEVFGKNCVQCGSQETIIRFVKTRPYIICTCGKFNEINKQGYKHSEYIVNEQYVQDKTKYKINKIYKKNKKNKK